MATSDRQVADTVFMVRFLVDNKVLANDDDPAWTNVARYLDKHVSGLIYREDVFADDVIETEVHLVER